jgi:hypothetical protein
MLTKLGKAATWADKPPQALYFTGIFIVAGFWLAWSFGGWWAVGAYGLGVITGMILLRDIAYLMVQREERVKIHITQQEEK